MPPHVASPARLLASEVAAASKRWAAGPGVDVRCEGGWHRIGFDGQHLVAANHDEGAEAVVRSLGGPVPLCVRLVTAAAAAEAPEWWASLSGGPVSDEPLRALPEALRRFRLAAALQAEFADAGEAVRDSVARLGLALLGDPPPPVDSLRVKFQMTRELPHWDPGPGPWSDKELVLLHRWFRGAPGELRPHLVRLPVDPIARSAVARYAVQLLDPARVLTAEDLRTALSPTFRNVKALTALLVSEGVLTPTDGGRHRVGGRRR